MTRFLSVRKTDVMKRRSFSIQNVYRSYGRMWVFGIIWGSVLFTLVGASFLFSFVHQVDWRICATFSVCLLLIVMLLLASVLAPHRSDSGHRPGEV